MAISEYNYIPKYIKRTIANKPKDVVTASYWNELFNLLITQGDHTAKELGNVLNHFTAAINEVKGIADGKYVKPTNGIPKTDLANDVQTSLSKADTALQTHQSLAAYRTAFAQDVIDSDLGDRISAIESKESSWDGKQDKLIAGENITIAADGKTISSTSGGAKAFFLNVFVITETEVITNKTYAEIKAAIDAGDIIYITDKNGIVYVPQVGTTNTKIELLWIESQGNRTLYWTAVVDSENAWSAAEFELVEIDKLVFELSDKVDKETGKGLSTNDYTYADKAKVDAIPASPKYTDTVYDDTAVKNRLTAIENKENVTLTPNTARISNVSCTAKYFPLLGMVFVRIYGKICADLNVGYDYDLFTVGSRVPDSNAALSVKCGKNAMALAKTSSSGSAIQIRPLESGINGYDVFITGFWFA